MFRSGRSALIAAWVLAWPVSAPAAGPPPGRPCAAPPATPPAAPPPPDLPADLVAQAGAVQAYPTFCSIPPTPTGVRSATAFRLVVRQTRTAGAEVQLAAEPSRFGLAGTASFAAEARAEAAPPPPMTAPDEASAEAFAKKARQSATPPSRPR